MRFLARVTAGVGIASLALAIVAASEPRAFGANGHEHPAAKPTVPPLAIAGDPFAWPADRPLPEPSAPAFPAGQSAAGVGDGGTVPSLLVFVGEHPWAMVPGLTSPLHIGDAFAGSTIRDITPLGVVLKNGHTIVAGEANYAGNTAPGTTPLPIIPSIQSRMPYQPYTGAALPAQPYPANTVPTTAPAAATPGPPPLPYHLSPQPSQTGAQ